MLLSSFEAAVLCVAAVAGLVPLPVGTRLRFSGRTLGLLAVAGHAPSNATKVAVGHQGAHPEFATLKPEIVLEGGRTAVFERQVQAQGGQPSRTARRGGR